MHCIQKKQCVRCMILSHLKQALWVVSYAGFCCVRVLGRRSWVLTVAVSNSRHLVPSIALAHKTTLTNTVQCMLTPQQTLWLHTTRFLLAYKQPRNGCGFRQLRLLVGSLARQNPIKRQGCLAWHQHDATLLLLLLLRDSVYRWVMLRRIGSSSNCCLPQWNAMPRHTSISYLSALCGKMNLTADSGFSEAG